MIKIYHDIADRPISGCRRFDIKWTAPKAEGSLTDARGDIIISPDHITVNSSSVAFDLYSKVLTSYRDDYCLNLRDYHVNAPLPFTVEGVELDLRMRSFEFFSSVSSYALDSPKPVHLKATGRIKFQGKVVKASSIADQHFVHSEKRSEDVPVECNDATDTLSGEVSISGLKLNQLMLAPQMAGALSITQQGLKVCPTSLFLIFVYPKFMFETAFEYSLLQLSPQLLHKFLPT